MSVYTIYVMVNGGPAVMSEHATWQAAEIEYARLKDAAPQEHYVCHENLFATDVYPPDAEEETAPIPDDD